MIQVLSSLIEMNRNVAAIALFQLVLYVHNSVILSDIGYIWYWILPKCGLVPWLQVICSC